MTSLPNYPGHLQNLIADPLQTARSAADGGRPVVGYVGSEVPVALVLAADALPVRLHGIAAGSTARADVFLESAFVPELRAITERWLAGDLDFLRCVVFPRADDSSQRLYYYLCELQRRGLCGGPQPLLYDIARIRREASVHHSRDSTKRLAQALGSRDDALAGAVQRVSEREALLEEVRHRCRAESPLAGSAGWRVRHAASCDWRDEFDVATAGWLNEARSIVRPRRILLAGDAPPTDSLHRIIEDAGGSVVLELTESIVGDAPAAAASTDSLGDHFHARRNPVLAMRENPRWVADNAREVQADGVVLWLIEEDEALPWEIARQMHALREQNIPTLLLARQSWSTDEAARQQLAAFVAGVEMKR
jgi:hypothetical protein